MTQRERATQFGTYLLGAGFFLACMWIWYLLENYAGISIKGRRLAPDKTPLALWIPLASTPLAVLVAAFFWWKAGRFYSKAVTVSAKVVSVGKISTQGLRDLTVRYTYGEQSFEASESMSDAHVQSYEPGDSLEVLIDPDHPGRASISIASA